MLDTNTLDYIFNNQDRLAVDLINSSRKTTNFYITRVQRYEIDKIKDPSKKKSINKILLQIGTRTIFPSKLPINSCKVTSYCSIQSQTEIFEIKKNALNEGFFRKLYEQISNRKVNFSDLLILYTAINNKMNYLITDNMSDFKPLLEKLIITNGLQLKKNHVLDNLQTLN